MTIHTLMTVLAPVADLGPGVERRLDDLAARWPRGARVRHRDTGRRGTISFDYDAPGGPSVEELADRIRTMRERAARQAA